MTAEKNGSKKDTLNKLYTELADLINSREQHDKEVERLEGEWGKKGVNENRGKARREGVSIGETTEEIEEWEEHKRARQADRWKIDEVLEQIGKIEEGLTKVERIEVIET